MEASIRRATEADTAALRDALVLALAWRDPAFPPDPERFLRESGHGRLIDQWGRPGDAAVIAETPSGTAGAAWYRFWTCEDHSYGFIAKSIPELGVGVHHPYRGRGIGKALLVGLLEHAPAGDQRGQLERRARQSRAAPLQSPGLRWDRRGGERLHDGQEAVVGSVRAFSQAARRPASPAKKNRAAAGSSPISTHRASLCGGKEETPRRACTR